MVIVAGPSSPFMTIPASSKFGLRNIMVMSCCPYEEEAARRLNVSAGIVHEPVHEVIIARHAAIGESDTDGRRGRCRGAMLDGDGRRADVFGDSHRSR